MAAPGGAGLTWCWLLCLPLCLLGGLQSAQVLAGGASSPPVCLAKPAHSLDTFLVGVLQEFPALAKCQKQGWASRPEFRVLSLGLPGDTRLLGKTVQTEIFQQRVYVVSKNKTRS